MPRNFHAHAEPKWYSRSIAIYFYEKLDNGQTAFVENIVMKTVGEDEAVEPSDTFSVPLETAQELMDSLWQCGIRPSEGTGSAGSLKATQDHLKDLQEFSRRLLSMVESTPSNTART